MKYRRGLTAVIAAALLFLCFGPGLHVQARIVLENEEPELDFTDVSGDEDLPEELKGKVLTDELKQALQDAMAADNTDPEAILDARGQDGRATSGDTAAEGDTDEQGNPTAIVIDPTDGSPLVLIGDSEVITMDKLTLVEHPKLSVSRSENGKSFIYTLPNGSDFSMTAPLGGIANDPVTITAGEGMEFKGMWKENQSLLAEADADDETEPADLGVQIDGDSITVNYSGDYQFILISDGISNGQVDDSFMLRGAFRILNVDERVRTGYIGTPPGLTLSLVTVNGQKQEITDRYGLQLMKDGNYHLQYTLGKSTWDVSFVRDTTPPMLLFSVPIEEVLFDGPVSWQIYRPDTEVTVYWNNMPLDAPDNTVAGDGRYRIVAKDSVGNSRTYQFIISRGMKLHPELFLAALGILLVVSFVVILLYRRRLDVR
ncbi:MAG: hypothetical protein K6G16_11345 [Lachnospiraceae bacterium]|nr:hypothetical protein [Lachnospiraceae bacterium]